MNCTNLFAAAGLAEQVLTLTIGAASVKPWGGPWHVLDGWRKSKERNQLRLEDAMYRADLSNGPVSGTWGGDRRGDCRQNLANVGIKSFVLIDVMMLTACRSMESAVKLVERFIAGVTKPARPSTPEAENNPQQYDGPPRTAEQLAA